MLHGTETAVKDWFLAWNVTLETLNQAFCPSLEQVDAAVTKTTGFVLTHLGRAKVKAEDLVNRPTIVVFPEQETSDIHID